MDWRGYVNYSQRIHYFESKAIKLEVVDDLERFNRLMNSLAPTSPFVLGFFSNIGTEYCIRQRCQPHIEKPQLRVL